MSAERNEYGVIEVPPANAQRTEETPRFDQAQKEWPDGLVAQAEAYLCEYYQQRYDITPEDIYNIEDYYDEEYVTDDALRLLHIIDYGGLDIRVDCSEEMIDVALRIRPQNPHRAVDFSFRTENGIDGKAAEYDKWLTAYDGGDGTGYYPGVIAFGVATEDEDAFDEFYLIKTTPFLDGIDSGTLRGDGPYDSPDGQTKAMYYPIEDLRESGCILESWGDGA